MVLPDRTTSRGESLFERILEKNYGNFRRLVESSYGRQSPTSEQQLEEPAEADEELVAAED